MLRPAILIAPLVAAAIAIGCGVDTSHCSGYCAAQERQCPVTAPTNDECINACQQQFEGLDNVSDSCSQAYDDWLVCVKSQGAFDCSAPSVAPSGCDSEQTGWASCGIR